MDGEPTGSGAKGIVGLLVLCVLMSSLLISLGRAPVFAFVVIGALVWWVDRLLRAQALDPAWVNPPELSAQG